MLKTAIRSFLKANVVMDALYTEKQYLQNDGLYMECSVWSASAGYAVTVKRKIKTKGRKCLEGVREAFLAQVEREKEKFQVRFEYLEEEEDEFNVLLNDGFDYDEYD